MGQISKKVQERLTTTLKRFQPILASAKSRDVNESDTVIIVTDMLSEIFGYDKYAEITSEHAIRGTFCDLAIKLDGQVSLLIEVKAIGLELKDQFVKQAVDYAANLGTDWVLLTNGETWRVYRVTFGKPIEQELVYEFTVGSLDHKNEDDIDALFRISKEGWSKSALGDYHTQKQALSRFSMAALITSETVLEVVRRELRRMSPDVKIEVDQIRHVLEHEVLKREVVEGEKAVEARKKVNRAANRTLRAATSKKDAPETPAPLVLVAEATEPGAPSPAASATVALHVVVEAVS